MAVKQGAPEPVISQPQRTDTFLAKCIRALREPFPGKVNRLIHLYFLLKGRFYYRYIFGSFGQGSVLYTPMLLHNPRHIHIGRKVLIRKGARLEAIIADPAHLPELRIEDHVRIEQDAHIITVGKTTLREYSGLAPRCSLLCSAHPFLDIHDPVRIADRLVGVNSVIEIGAGSMIGVGSVILMNVRIGKHVVVGSNAVVRKSVPDYSIVEGNPAAIIMQYDHDKERWVRTGNEPAARR